MARYLKYILISLIVLSLLAKFFLIFLNQGLWWDEAVYLGLGKNIPEGFYSLDPGESIETFRPPVFPLLISPLSSSILLSRVFVVCFSILAVVLAYLLSKKLFGKEIALWVSLFLSTNQLFIFFTTKTLTESLFVSFLSLSLIFFLGHKNRNSYLLISGMFSGLAFLTRYLGTILMISYVIYFLYLFSKRMEMKRSTKEFILLLAGFFLILALWFTLSYIYYGNILGAYITNMMVYSGALPSVLSTYVSEIFQVFGLQILFIILGFYLMLKHSKNERILFLALFIIPIIFFSFAPHREPRYILSYIPVYAIFSGFALKCEFRPAKRFLPLLAVLVCIFSMITGFGMVWNDRFAANALVQSSLYLKTITGENDSIMSQSYPYLYYLSERKAFTFPRDREGIEDFLTKNGIKYILLYKFEPGNPDYAEDYFDKSDEFALVKKFEQWGDPDAVRIYEFVSR